MLSASRGNPHRADAGLFVLIVHMYTYALLYLYSAETYPSRRDGDGFVSAERSHMLGENFENDAKDNARTMSRKWGSDVASAGFTSLPNHLLSINQFVRKENRLTPTELLTLFQILSAWWHADRLPFPSKATIAKRLGLSPRQVQRALNGLEEKGYITRVARFYQNKGRASNSYDLSKIVALVQVVAGENPDAFKRRRSSLAA
jgi:predicted transcriptional regulator